MIRAGSPHVMLLIAHAAEKHAHFSERIPLGSF
jgi:hypothetical protein